MANLTRNGCFTKGRCRGPVDFRGVRLGIPVCEDIWGDLGVGETLAESGAELLLVPNGSPYYRGKIDIRHQVAIRQVIETDLPILYANQLGGQDELVFDGASFAFNADRKLAFQMSQFEAQVSVTTWRRGEDGWYCDDGRCRAFRTPRRRITAPACWDCATTSTRTASGMSCSGL